jgi:hypothetical protein
MIQNKKSPLLDIKDIYEKNVVDDVNVAIDFSGVFR